MSGSPSSRAVGPGLREGFTTGTAATAAARAALIVLLGGEEAPAAVETPLPPFSDQGRPAGHLAVPVAGVERLDARTARGVVVKDGGDDPDVTHGARIEATVRLAPFAECAAPQPGGHAVVLPGPVPVLLAGGTGIGRVTLPGLPVAVGEPAINPAPRRQIQAALAESARAFGYRGGLSVTLAVRDGEERAKKTLNPRLGIVGGLSILGTHGTVRPYSHAAWRASIKEGLSVARAVGCERAALSTGRRSERLLQALYPELPPPAFVQAADFAAFSLGAAADYGFTRLIWGCFFGKLVKLAQGLSSTHAHDAPLDLETLAAWCEEAGMTRAESAPLAACVTAGEALELILTHPRSAAILAALAERARAVAVSFSRGSDVTLHLFHINGAELARAGACS